MKTKHNKKKKNSQNDVTSKKQMKVIKKLYNDMMRSWMNAK